MAIPKHVLDLAVRQGGYVRRDQLVALGLSLSAVDRRVSAGDLNPATAGVYMIMPSEDYVDLLRGAVLGLPQAVVSHQSAAHLLRFPRRPVLVPTVVVPSHTTHRFPGVTVRRCSDLAASDIVSKGW
ncbi:MAG: type IV toxin-antitoxin system AbiEi family antitoxin domain-containing protein [Acidimicrobiia bacterium]